MAEVQLTISQNDNRIGKKDNVNKEIEKFTSKWSKEVSLFEGSLFREHNQNIWLLTKPGEELEISTRDYGRSEENPNKSRAIFKLLSYTTEKEGDFDFGENAFEIDFYKDLLKLFEIENEVPGFTLDVAVTVVSYAYYTGVFEFYSVDGYKSVIGTAKFDDESDYDDDLF